MLKSTCIVIMKELKFLNSFNDLPYFRLVLDAFLKDTLLSEFLLYVTISMNVHDHDLNELVHGSMGRNRPMCKQRNILNFMSNVLEKKIHFKELTNCVTYTS